MSPPAHVHLSRRKLLTTSLAAGAATAVPILRPASRRAMAAPASPGAGDDRARAFDELAGLAQHRMTDLRVPGVALGVLADGEEHTAGFGVTNVDHPLPVDADILFQIGSTTKTYTGTAVMRLVEQGRVELDAPVRTYLPDFRVVSPAASRGATLRHLVTHTAGWVGDHDVDTGDGDDALALAVAAMADLPQVAPAGRFYGYNNAAVAVAGRVIEAVTGQTYEAAVEALVLAPLGLERTRFSAEAVMTDAFAVGHDAPTGEPVVVGPWALPRAVNPAGGLIASVTDQLRYARFHLGDGTTEGKRVLGAEALRRMGTRLGPGGGDGPCLLDGVGVTWLLRRVGGALVAGHGGSTNGQQSAFALVPERGFAVAVLSNANAGEALATELVAAALDRFLGLREPPFSPKAIERARLADYEGQYDLPDGSGGRVWADGDGLVLAAVVRGQPLGEISLLPAGPDRFVVADGGTILDRVDFERDDRGRVGWVRAFARLVPRAG